MQTQLNKTLAKLTKSFRDLNEKMLNQVGLHSGQAQILSTLWIKDGQSQAEIVKELNVSPPTVNSLVNKLKKANFVKCKKCIKDKRLIRVFLTEKGYSMKSEAEEQWKKIDEAILQDFSETERILVIMWLEKIKNNLQNTLSNQ